MFRVTRSAYASNMLISTKEKTPRAPARARLPLLRFRPGGVGLDGATRGATPSLPKNWAPLRGCQSAPIRTDRRADRRADYR